MQRGVPARPRAILRHKRERYTLRVHHLVSGSGHRRLCQLYSRLCATHLEARRLTWAACGPSMLCCAGLPVRCRSFRNCRAMTPAARASGDDGYAVHLDVHTQSLAAQRAWMVICCTPAVLQVRTWSRPSSYFADWCPRPTSQVHHACVPLVPGS